MAAIRRDDLTAVQRLVKEAADRLEATWTGEKKFSIRSLELSHGIPNGTVGKLIKGQTRTLTPKVAKKVGALLGIPWEKLADDETPPPPTAEGSVTPPPATTVRVVVNDEHQRAIDEAFDGSRHKVSDADAVREILTRRAALLDETADPIAILRTWLDMAASLRERGRPRTVESILGETSAQLAARTRHTTEQARAESKARGYEPPPEEPRQIRQLRKKPSDAE